MKVMVRTRKDGPPRIALPAGRLEVALALAAFAVLCVLVLRIAPQLVEPDDYAYRASSLRALDQ